MAESRPEKQQKIITRVDRPLPSAPSLKRVAAYARVSMESERLIHSLSAQVSYYSELIQRTPGWEYAGVYADEFISGTRTAGRTEFQRLMEDCEKGLVDIILCKSISRFSRNTVDLLENIRRLRELGISVRFEKENIDSLTSDGELMMTLLATFSQEESRNQSANIKWAVQKKFERGETWHTAPFGYRWDGETFIVEPGEAEVVRRIYSDFLSDVPLKQTARWMKEEGWTNCNVYAIEYILQNITYTGDVITQKYFTADPLTHELVKNEGQMPRRYISGNHEAIIPMETFKAVQEKIRANLEYNREANRFTKPSCFSAKLVCPLCGSNYVKNQTRSSRRGGLKENWTCHGKIKNGPSYCSARNIKGENLRESARIALGLESFGDPDEAAEEAMKSVRRITPVDGDMLEFEFYNGHTVSAPVKYYSTSARKHMDPHTAFFGYEWSDDGYVVIPNQAEAARLMYEYYADGMTISDIRRKLYAAGYRSSHGGLSNKLIAQALDSSLYIGERMVKAQFSGTGRDEVIHDDHKAVVSRELDRAVKERRKRELKKQEKRLKTLARTREAKKADKAREAEKAGDTKKAKETQKEEMEHGHHKRSKHGKDGDAHTADP